MSGETQQRLVLAGRLFGLGVPRLAQALGRKPTAAEKQRLHAAVEEEAWGLPADALDESSPQAREALDRAVARAGQ